MCLVSKTACLCKECLTWDNEVESVYPDMRKLADGRYLLMCPRCYFYAGPDENPQSVITLWALINEPGIKFKQDLWLKDHKEQQDKVRANR